MKKVFLSLLLWGTIHQAHLVAAILCAKDPTGAQHCYGAMTCVSSWSKSKNSLLSLDGSDGRYVTFTYRTITTQGRTYIRQNSHPIGVYWRFINIGCNIGYYAFSNFNCPGDTVAISSTDCAPDLDGDGQPDPEPNEPLNCPANQIENDGICVCADQFIEGPSGNCIKPSNPISDESDPCKYPIPTN